ncbi:sporulation integral membrane protein YtvI [Gracilibacillus sp. YIM 98692]|uniref:sporulation integral membrane protein YtvI n=1 Tax=Gracilibacillus sp. YIM 98692 TaxID=2663532 RepID=UPI0013D40418|nr:sporulation integral membrane protein YtvI [Gracilibacillus sp. YIM 98692]
MFITKNTLYRSTILLAVISLFIISVFFTIQYLFPFVLACLFALILYPIISLLVRITHLHHTISCLLVICSAIVVTVVSMIFILMELFQGIVYLSKWIPEKFQSLFLEIAGSINAMLIPIMQKITSYMNSLSEEQHALIREQVEELSINLADKMGQVIEGVLNWIGSQLAALPGSITIIIFSLLLTFFICKDWGSIKAFMLEKIPPKPIEVFQDICIEMKRTFWQYIKAQLLLVTIAFITIFIGLMLIGIKHAFTIAVIIAMIDLLPILGTAVVFFPWILYLFVIGDISSGISISLLYTVVVATRQILEPKLVSNAIGIHPILTILSIYLSFQIFGVKGIWLGPALLLIFKAFHQVQLFAITRDYILSDKPYRL